MNVCLRPQLARCCGAAGEWIAVPVRMLNLPNLFTSSQVKQPAHDQRRRAPDFIQLKDTLTG